MCEFVRIFAFKIADTMDTAGNLNIHPYTNVYLRIIAINYMRYCALLSLNKFIYICNTVICFFLIILSDSQDLRQQNLHAENDRKLYESVKERYANLVF